MGDWEETFYVRCGDRGTERVPGYAARAMMRLVRELAALAHRHDPRLAFLTADCIGHLGLVDVPPYALIPLANSGSPPLTRAKTPARAISDEEGGR